MPDFSWITEIDEAAWVPELLGKVSVKVAPQELRRLSDIPEDMPQDEMLRLFDAWSYEQEHEYHLMHQPGPNWLLTREGRRRA